MSNPTSSDADLSVTEFRKSAVAFAEIITAKALFWWAMAAEARDTYKAHPQWVESLERTAYLYKVAAQRAQALYGTIWTRNRKIFNRIYHPRGGSLTAEMRADNIAAIRDHNAWHKK
jgi:hypothetical protein